MRRRAKNLHGLPAKLAHSCAAASLSRINTGAPASSNPPIYRNPSVACMTTRVMPKFTGSGTIILPKYSPVSRNRSMASPRRTVVVSGITNTCPAPSGKTPTMIGFRSGRTSMYRCMLDLPLANFSNSRLSSSDTNAASSRSDNTTVVSPASDLPRIRYSRESENQMLPRPSTAITGAGEKNTAGRRSLPMSTRSGQNRIGGMVSASVPTPTITGNISITSDDANAVSFGKRNIQST